MIRARLLDQLFNRQQPFGSDQGISFVQDAGENHDEDDPDRPKHQPARPKKRQLGAQAGEVARIAHHGFQG